MTGTMRAVVASAPGDAGVLEVAEVPAPGAPGPGEVLIRVAAAGLNNADLLQRRGRYRVPAGASPILGLECSGVIEAVGRDVAGLAVGDPVCALLAGGAYAELVRVPAAQVLPVPAGVDLVAAAGLPEVACTVHSNLARVLAPGAALLVHGGGSGIGTFAIQWATAIGAVVLATAGSARKLEAALGLGAAGAIDYHEQDFVAEVLAATDGRGADAILDVVGAPYLARNVAALAADGTLVLLGGDLSPTEVSLDDLMAKRATLAVSALRSRPAAQKAAVVAGVRREVWPLVAAGRIAPVVDAVLPMDRAADAHRLLESGSTIGKVLLAVG